MNPLALVGRLLRRLLRRLTHRRYRSRDGRIVIEGPRWVWRKRG